MTNLVSKTPVESHERRASCRYGLSLPVIVRTAGQPSRSASSKDVSTGGVYLLVETDDKLLLGAELDLTLALPKDATGGDELLVHAHGRTVRIDKFGKDGTGGIGVAVVFETYDFIRSTPASFDNS